MSRLRCLWFGTRLLPPHAGFQFQKRADSDRPRRPALTPPSRYTSGLVIGVSELIQERKIKSQQVGVDLELPDSSRKKCFTNLQSEFAKGCKFVTVDAPVQNYPR